MKSLALVLLFSTQLLDPRVRDAAASRNYPSIVIGVIEGEQRQIETLGKTKPDANAIFEIGSATKTFTGLLLAEAIERGEVKLETPVADVLTGYAIPKEITFGELATQSSGLPRLPSNLAPKDPLDPYVDYTADDLKAFFATWQPARKAGERYEYSNLGFGLLGHALATRANTTYEKLVRERITAPLKMHDTTITLTPEQQKRFLQGHNAAGAPVPPWNLGTLEGAGALRSTANDLLTYLAAHMKPKSKSFATAIAPRRGRNTTDEQKIALGWHIDKDLVWHNGMTGGYASFVGFTADGKRGVVILTNISRDVSQLGFNALNPSTIKATPKEITIAPEALDEYLGRYQLTPQFALTVTRDGNQLLIQGTGQEALPVHASAKDEFFSKLVDAQFSFKRDADGKVTSVVLHQNGRDMPAPRVGDAPVRKVIELAPNVLKSYVGRYELAPTFVLDVTAEGSQLFVQATGQPRFPVFATAHDEFFYKVVDAQLSFKRGTDGLVDAVVLHQNGQDVRGKKVDGRQ